MSKTIKEIIIMLLVCLITMLILAIALYQYIPNRKAVPEVTTYVASEDVQDLLEDNIDTRKDDDNVILTYEVTSSDLNSYQSANAYVPGKSNPFAAYSGTPSTGESGKEPSDNGNNQSSGTETGTNPNQSSETKTPEVYSQNSGTK